MLCVIKKNAGGRTRNRQNPASLNGAGQGTTGRRAAQTERQEPVTVQRRRDRERSRVTLQAPGKRSTWCAHSRRRPSPAQHAEPILFVFGGWSTKHSRQAVGANNTSFFLLQQFGSHPWPAETAAAAGRGVRRGPEAPPPPYEPRPRSGRATGVRGLQAGALLLVATLAVLLVRRALQQRGGEAGGQRRKRLSARCRPARGRQAPPCALGAAGLPPPLGYACSNPASGSSQPGAPPA